MMDTVTRHRQLVMLGVVRTMVDVDDDPWELDEVSAAIVYALDAFDETRRKAPLRIPKGFEGGGRFRKISDVIFQRIQDWAKGDVDNPFEGQDFTREHLRKAAKERGLTLRRGATFNEIANALLDDVRKGRGDRKPDAKPDAPEGPKAKKKLPGSDQMLTPRGVRERQEHTDGEKLDVQNIQPGDEVQTEEGKWHKLADVRSVDRIYVAGFDADGEQVFRVPDSRRLPTRKKPDADAPDAKPVKKAAPKKAAPDESPRDALARLREAKNHEEGREVLQGKTIPQLRAIADAAGVTLGRQGKENITNDLIYGAVIRPRDSKALREADISSPASREADRLDSVEKARDRQAAIDDARNARADAAIERLSEVTDYARAREILTSTTSEDDRVLIWHRIQTPGERLAVSSTETDETITNRIVNSQVPAARKREGPAPIVATQRDTFWGLPKDTRARVRARVTDPKSRDQWESALRAEAPGEFDSVLAARQRQDAIDDARRYADAAAELDELLANDASDATLLSRLDARARREGIEADVAPVRAALTGETTREIEIENRIRAAYRAELASRGEAPSAHSAFVGLADIRDALGENYSRAEVDRVLQDMRRRSGDSNEPGAVRLIKIANTKALKQRDYDAAIPNPGAGDDRTSQLTGGFHAIAMADPTARPAPTGDKDRARALMRDLLAAHGITQDGQAGDTGRFDPKLHQPIDGSLRPGQAVEVVRPGMVLDRDGETIRVRRAVVEAGDEAPPRLSDAEVDGRIRDAYRDLSRRPGDWVPLADLRDRLGNVDRRDVDAALERLAVTPGHQVIPWDNRKALTDRDRAASVRIGGDETHAIRIEPDATPDPAEATRDALDLKTVPQLKAMLRERGLPVSGRKRELVDRLVDVGAGAPGGPDAPPAGRPSGLPTDRKPESGDFDDLADRIGLLPQREKAARLREILADLNKAELRRLARKFPGVATSHVSQSLNVSVTQAGLRIPDGLSLEEMREWLLEHLTRRTWTWRSDDMDAETRDRVLALAEVRFADEIRAMGADVTPGRDKLHHWWVYGEGRARWKTWTELYGQLAKIPEIGPAKAKRFASAWFHERYGYWSGSDVNRVKHGKPPRGQRVGPG